MLKETIFELTSTIAASVPIRQSVDNFRQNDDRSEAEYRPDEHPS